MYKKGIRPVFWFFFAAFLLCEPKAFSGNEADLLPWKALPRLSRLGASERTAYLEVLKNEQNYGICEESVYECLKAEKADQTAVRIANFGAYLVSKGIHPDNLGPLIQHRAAFATQKAIDTLKYTNSPSKGSPLAEIVLTEFAEFKCNHCVALSPLLEKLVKESKGLVRLYFKHFPIKNHSGSLLSSQAAQAAHRQGKFWEMYDHLFRDMNKQSMDDLLRYAAEIGLDLEMFKRDMADPTLIEIIERDKIEGVRAKVQGTPTLFINGKMYYFLHQEEFLKDIINEEAERMAVTPPYADWRY